jgi:hypothetical protein
LVTRPAQAGFVLGVQLTVAEYAVSVVPAAGEVMMARQLVELDA